MVKEQHQHRTTASASTPKKKQQTTELFSFYIIPRIVLTGSSMLIYVHCTHTHSTQCTGFPFYVEQFALT